MKTTEGKPKASPVAGEAVDSVQASAAKLESRVDGDSQGSSPAALSMEKQFEGSDRSRCVVTSWDGL